jgi:hypothetical protein
LHERTEWFGVETRGEVRRRRVALHRIGMTSLALIVAGGIYLSARVAHLVNISSVAGRRAAAGSRGASR